MSNPVWHSLTGTQSPTIRHLPLNQMSNPAWHSHTETQSPSIQHLAWIRCQTQRDSHTLEHSLQVSNTYHKSDVKPAWHSHTGTQSPSTQHLPQIRCQTQRDTHTLEHSLQGPNTYHKSDVKPRVTFTHRNTVSNYPTLTTKSDVKPCLFRS